MDGEPIQSKQVNTTHYAHETLFVFTHRPLYGGRIVPEQSSLDGRQQKAFEQQ
jgi:hypothetical protein